MGSGSPRDGIGIPRLGDRAPQRWARDPQAMGCDPQAMAAAAKDGRIAAVIWDFEQPQQKLSNRPFYTKLVPARPAAPGQVQVTHLAPKATYRLEVYRTGYHANDAYSAYLEMGSPGDLTPTQVEQLNNLTRDLPETDRAVRSSPDGTIGITVPMSSNDIVLVKLTQGRRGKQAGRAGP